MDPITSVVQAQQADLLSQVQFAVAKKALDNAKVQGEAVVQLIQSAARVGKTAGAGENFDATG